MKNLYTIIKLSLISLVLPFLFFSNLVAQNAVTIPHSKSIKLYSPAIQDTFAISIAFPEQYDSSDKSYPVIYVTDPFFVYGSTVESARMHVYDGRMPEAIIVGIGYPGPQKFRRIMQLRTREYTILDRFVFPSGFTPQWAKEMDLGNAQEFLSFMEDNLFPYITENYRVTDERTYIGWSGGGWYGHYVLFFSQIPSTVIFRAVLPTGMRETGNMKATYLSMKSSMQPKMTLWMLRSSYQWAILNHII